MCAQVTPSGECLRGKGPPDRMLAKPSRRLAAYILSVLNLIVAAVLRDSMCHYGLRGRLLHVVYRV